MCDTETLVSVVGSGQGWELCSRVHCQFLLCPLGYAFSEDGEYFAYGLSASGSDWVTIKFMKVDGARELPDVLERVKFSCMAWTHDGKGMFYNAYPQQDGKSDGRLRLQMKHLFHEMKCVATWLREEARPYVEVAWSRTMFSWRTLCLLLLLCNTSCQNFVVHNNDHLFLLASLQIGQAVLGVAEFCRVPVSSCQSVAYVWGLREAACGLSPSSRPARAFVQNRSPRESRKARPPCCLGLLLEHHFTAFFRPKQVTGPFKGGEQIQGTAKNWSHFSCSIYSSQM